MNVAEEKLINIASLLEESAEKYPYRPAIIFPEGKDRNGKVSYTHYTFEQLFKETKLIAKALEKYGITKGTKTVLMVKPSLDFIALVYALLSAGIIPVIIDPGLGIKNLKTCIAEVEPTAFIGVTKAHVARIIMGWGKGTINKLITVGGNKLFWGGLTLEELKQTVNNADDYKIMKTDGEDTAAIVFTSGSTGVPKGVVYTHKNFYAEVLTLRDTYGLKPGEVDLPTLPVFALFDPAWSVTSVIPDMDFTKPAEVDPKKIIQAIEDFGVTHMFGSPALVNRVGRYGEENKIKLPSLKRVLSAGAPVPSKVLARFKEMLLEDAEIYTPYGATECLPVTSIGTNEILGETKALTDQGKGVCIGRAVQGVEISIIKISDDVVSQWSDDLKLKTGEVGEIVVKGDNVTKSYYNRKESTDLAKIYEKDGKELRHRMGDLGYFDEKGRIWFCGRKAHRVITDNGVYFTIPCEAIYNTHQDVYRTALVGVKINGKMNPVICIEVDQNSKTKNKDSIKKELFEISNKFEHTKSIKYILFHDSFPVDIRHNSKIFREKLAVWAETQNLS